MQIVNLAAEKEFSRLLHGVSETERAAVVGHLLALCGAQPDQPAPDPELLAA